MQASLLSTQVILVTVSLTVQDTHQARLIMPCWQQHRLRKARQGDSCRHRLRWPVRAWLQLRCWAQQTQLQGPQDSDTSPQSRTVVKPRMSMPSRMSVALAVTRDSDRLQRKDTCTCIKQGGRLSANQLWSVLATQLLCAGTFPAVLTVW
jgi:hypothetical protein